MSTDALWTEYVAWLKDNVPAAYANLAPGANAGEIEALEQGLGVTLPESVKAVWRLNNGQRETMVASHLVKATPCLPTLMLLSTEWVRRVWAEWAGLREQLSTEDLTDLHRGTRSVPAGVVKPLYTAPLWIPLWADPTRADYVGLDLDPGEAGVRGQIINFGRNEDDHFQFAVDFDDLLEFLLAEVRSGAWRASEMDYGDDDTVPWFGEPRAHFFNALHKRWSERHP